MKPSLQKIQKYLKLEADRGYDNRAVLGGLERMLAPWEAEARVDELSEDFIQVVVSRLRDYQRLSPKSRAEALQGLWRRIQREGNTTLPSLAPAPTETLQEAGVPAQLKPKSEGKTLPKLGVETVEADSHIKHENKVIPPPEAHDAISQLTRIDNELIQPAQPQSTPEQATPEQTTSGQTTLEQTALEQIAPELDLSPEIKRYETAVKPISSTRVIPEGVPAALNAPITVLPGVGPRHGQTLGRLGLKTLGDMLYFYPRRYDDYTKLRPINRLHYRDEVTVIAAIQNIAVRPIRGGQAEIVEAVVSDGTGALRVTWFNQHWITKRIRPGLQVVLSGKIDQYLGRLVMNSPECELLEQQNLNTNRIVPVYPLSANITQRWLRRTMYQVVSYWGPRIQDPLPEWVRRDANLIDLPNALVQIHFPDTADRLSKAQHRMAFDEIFYLQLGVLRQKNAWQNRSARIYDTHDEWLQTQLKALPFPLTQAQERVLSEIRADLASGKPMNRLLQGDVGSGKTVIAALAIAILANHGAQSALLAPTSILAEQHYKSLLSFLCGGQTQDSSSSAVLSPDQVRLMIGATSESDKQAIRDGLASGEIKVVIGTHALLEEPVVFSDLQLAIVDEQHRFGVDQRGILRSKGNNPHLLVMTATPIPRSLALTVYGDLDLSVIDEMPPGRQTIDTHVLYPLERERAYALIHNQVDKKRQAFIIYPLVEENENSETPAAVEECARLQKSIFPQYKLGLLHGRMKPEEKDEVMSLFRDQKIDILVSTSVVEVGVDIPNATVMLIEGANRFGLAQLHQFRGRVGRGQDKAYCLLIPETPDAIENERLKAMSETNDGFILAERDLEQRGPGEFLGTRQSGYSDLRLANLADVRLIEKARKASLAIFQKDPDLSQPEHHLLATTLQHLWGEDIIKGDIN
jgi:ATP-dependent DNA helicase RecG